MKSIKSPALLAATLSALLCATHAAAQSNNAERCSKKLGVLAVAEPQQGWAYLSQYQLGSPAALLRMMVQNSGCFDVVERGVGMQNLKEERALAEGGELRGESNVGKGQMQAADFVMTPNIQVSSSDTGGVGGAIGGALLGRFGLGGVAGGLKFKEASTSLLISDVRSSIQVASAEGKATKTDFDIGGFGWVGIAGAAAGGYTKTPEGKVIAASLMDNYNNVVKSVRNQPSLQRDVGSLADETGKKVQGGAVFNEGDTIVPKIANVKLFATPADGGKAVATLSKGDEMIFMGEEQNGFLKVESGNGSGWVKKVLVSK